MTMYAQNLSGYPILADENISGLAQATLNLVPGVVTVLPLWVAQLPGFQRKWAAGKINVSLSSTMSPLITTIPVSEFPAVNGSTTLSAPVAISTSTQAVVMTYLIPANSAIVGSTFKLRAYGIQTVTTGTSAYQIAVGPNGLATDTTVTSASAPLPVAAGMVMDALVAVQSVGVNGTVIANCSCVLTGNAAVATTGPVTAVNTTVNNYITVSVGTTAGTHTVQTAALGPA